ncbi:hypothetical protein os1_34870 [Comamonadaceae bacterium OS-1]|nr:hypothetical protein os1_34870 [Comamonadaceae bacterium OS-1]
MPHPSAHDWQVLHIHPAAPAKPAVGAPCNGCGVCCLSAPCPLGILLSGRRRGACAALRWDDAQARYLCGAIAQPATVLGPRWRWAAPVLGRWARRWVAAGIGCDSTLEVDRQA